MAHSIRAAYDECVKICTAKHVRYSQEYGKRYNVVNGNYYIDCSGLIWVCLHDYGGWTTDELGGPWDFATENMTGKLLKCGFENVKNTGVIKAGDIGTTNGKGHTEMCYSGGTGTAVFMGAHTANCDNADNQVCIGSSGGNKNYKKTFYNILRCTDSDMSDASPIVHPETDINMYVVAAMAGNFWGESNINPAVWESLQVCDWSYIYSKDNPNKGGYGLGQWTNTSKSSMRLYNLYCYLRNESYETYSGNGQCAFIIEENVWQKLDAYSIKSLEDFLDSDSTDLSMLVETWQRCWEGLSSSSATEQRIGYATTCYNYLKDHKDDSVKWISSNNYLGESDILNNAVCLYQWFNAWHKNNGNPDINEEKYSDPGYTIDPENNPEYVQLTFLDILEALAGKSKNSGNGQKIHIKRTRK